ncbi:uncharacterized protein N7458_011838 [Penicillium daleae]|uniref:Uncharacterized protein n=1 Tax=Penicillium daleae TaxID=63821 RepID=A0AAD6BT84_9EURO|nr:uncharacterized protein N7458_011838 [Penicillium daleae]KAJ5432682.1 hypothetical protein N7458_011838 [Penicillium daleae]
MAESRESQHSILPSEEDLVTAKPQRSWNPLGGRSSPSLECAYLPPVFTHESFSEEVFREVELRITDSLWLPKNAPRNPGDFPIHITHQQTAPLEQQSYKVDSRESR